MDLQHYRFASAWRLAAPPDVVFRALREVADYPAWWPQVRRADRVDDSTYDMVVRSLLPYDLVFRSSQAVEDPVRGVLEASMTGDLVGFSRWTVTADGTRSQALFEEEVEAHKPLLRRLALAARPAFVANHGLMMRAGQRGLRAYVAGRLRGDT